MSAAPEFPAPATLPIGWEALHRDTRLLAARLQPLGPWKGIVAVARGGLVPAAIVARELDLRLVETVCVASYDDRLQRPARVLKGIAGDGDGLLMIDDLVDTGVTAGLLRAALPRAHFATVYAKPAGQSRVDTFAVPIAQESWILFPWDMAPQFSPPLSQLPLP